MKAVLPILFVLLVTFVCHAADIFPESTPQHSSDGLFEVYQMPGGVGKDVRGKPYFAGTRLFLRGAGSRAQGALLRENDRWMDQQWCPGEHLLGIEDHWDGHQSDVYIYEMELSPDRTIHYRLVFKSPWNDYDRSWSIEGWEPKSRAIRLKLDQGGNDGILGHEKWPLSLERHYTFRVGITPLIDSHYP
jgi:hypothetical protein